MDGTYLNQYFSLFKILDYNRMLEALPFDIASPLCITGSKSTNGNG